MEGLHFIRHISLLKMDLTLNTASGLGLEILFPEGPRLWDLPCRQEGWAGPGQAALQ